MLTNSHRLAELSDMQMYLVEGAGRAEDADVPHEEVVLVDDDVESLDGLRPQTLQLHAQRTHGTARTR